jgi:hypothetical protein
MRHSTRASDLSEKDANIPDKIKKHYAEVDRLAAEKIALAERVSRLISRARARLDADLTKMLALQGQEDPRHAQLHGEAAPYFNTSRANPVAQMNKSLRDAFGGDIPQEILPASPSASGTGYSLKSECPSSYNDVPVRTRYERRGYLRLDWITRALLRGTNAWPCPGASGPRKMLYAALRRCTDGASPPSTPT